LLCLIFLFSNSFYAQDTIITTKMEIEKTIKKDTTKKVTKAEADAKSKTAKTTKDPEKKVV